METSADPAAATGMPAPSSLSNNSKRGNTFVAFGVSFVSLDYPVQVSLLHYGIIPFKFFVCVYRSNAYNILKLLYGSPMYMLPKSILLRAIIFIYLLPMGAKG